MRAGVNRCAFNDFVMELLVGYVRLARCVSVDQERNQMKRFVLALCIASIVIPMTSGCGSGNAPTVTPEVAKERRDAYEAKMRDGAPRGQ